MVENYQISLSSEFRCVHMADRRLDRRLERIVSLLETRPASSFPNLAQHDSELEGIYRFLGNPRVSMPVILAGHVHNTVKPAADYGTILIAHDTTDFMFGGFSEREGLADLGGGYQGFWGHFSLALSADGARHPLGILSHETNVYACTKKVEQRKKYERRTEPAPIYGRWLRGVVNAEDALGEKTSAIHLMDRESDSFELLADMKERGSRFVTRVAQNRRLVEGKDASYISDKLSSMEAILDRSVPISKRKLEKSPNLRKRHPPREERMARLCLSASPITIQRPLVTRKALPEYLKLNLVHVWEIDVPEGEAPIEWTLYTTEPINTESEIASIVDWYRARWLIEEFFKSIKTGCRFEDKQLESYHSLQNALALTIPIAWNLLLLRFLNRHSPEADAAEVLNETQIQILKHLPVRKLTAKATVAEAMSVIATWGGHLKQNGPPGWLTLGRGYQKLIDAEAAWTAAIQSTNVINH